MAFFSLLLSSGTLLILPEGVVVGFYNFAWAKILGFQPKKIIRGPPLPLALCNFWAEKGGILKICPRVPKLKI